MGKKKKKKEKILSQNKINKNIQLNQATKVVKLKNFSSFFDNKLLFFPVLAGLVFFTFNAYYNYEFYHVNSFKILYMGSLLLICFVIFDVMFLGYNFVIKKRIIENIDFPWKAALLFLLPILGTYPGFFIHLSENLIYNHDYELATELVAMLWMVYLIRFINVSQEMNKAILIFLIIVGITMVYICFFGILEYFGKSFYTPTASDRRIKVTYGNINYLAGSLVPVLAIFLSLAIPKIEKREKSFLVTFHSYLPKWQHGLFFLFFIAIFITLFLTGTRAALSAGLLSILGLMFFIVISFIKKKNIYIPYLL